MKSCLPSALPSIPALPQGDAQSAVTVAEQQQMEAKSWSARSYRRWSSLRKNAAPSIKVEGSTLPTSRSPSSTAKCSPPKTLLLKDLGGEGGKCHDLGDVFFTEVKGNYRKSCMSITDYTGSINLKVRAQEGEDCSKWEGIGKGSTVIVRGDSFYGKYRARLTSCTPMMC